MNAEHVDDLLDLEALGALDGVESSLVRAHVATCPRCQVRLDDAEETAARLALSVPLVRAPAGIKMRLMESVHAADVPVEAPRPVRRVPTAIMRFNRRWGAVAAAVFLIPLAGLLSWNYVLQHQVNELKQENKQIQVAQRDQVVFALPSSLRAQLIPTEQAGDARGTVNWNPDEGKCMVRVRGLAKPDAGTTYHVYYQGRMSVIDAGELKPDDEGAADLIFDASKWRGDEYEVWVSAVRAHPEQWNTLLRATLRRS